MLPLTIALRLRTNLRQAARASTCRITGRSYSAGMPAPSLLTLRPERLADTGQEIIDLSGLTMKVVNVSVRHPRWPSPAGVRAAIKPTVRESTGRFPDGMMGFFYYHPGVPALAGGVRFRLCDSAAGFAAGRDLGGAYGPWQAQPVDLTAQAQYRAFIPLLLEERLVEEDVLVDAAKLTANALGRRYRLYSFSDPFLYDTRKTMYRFTFITRKSCHEHRFAHIFEDTRGYKNVFPYAGTFWARFEISTLREHATRGPCLLMRYLDTVEPVRCVVPRYDGYIGHPEPGAYIMRGGRPWFHPLKRSSGKFRDMMEQEGITPAS
ncbi:hypothetical protein HYPSUDRAFT_219079 [Hypholoma sublateritium FD-334 SS-4]|uniref:Uncharacterized protein n=1 Tax=Hypholoma sublateritium (strain FD-334 SS-4) TaxID=945553 RepID=A0A0D2NDF0_HYPSF|nr:hypothetical protein HYPSUDRAFT_219079 [Hypholoma sublateritium FD-334 SS-4]